jgi:transcriptional regulator of NAD metabolism
LTAISRQQDPVSASSLAKKMKVSRQVVVGDIALLRAEGNEIIATSRGYMIPTFNENHQYLRKVVCQHTPKESRDELYTVVDHEAVVLNVIVEHSLYGEITGGLNLTNRSEVDAFMDRSDSTEVKLLSELTMGIHIHTIACRNEAHFIQIEEALKEKGYLYK